MSTQCFRRARRTAAGGLCGFGFEALALVGRMHLPARLMSGQPRAPFVLEDRMPVGKALAVLRRSRNGVIPYWGNWRKSKFTRGSGCTEREVRARGSAQGDALFREGA